MCESTRTQHNNTTTKKQTKTTTTKNAPRRRAAVEQKVGELQVAVCDAVRVAVAHGAHDLPEKVARLRLVEAVRRAVRAQVAALLGRHHDAQVAARQDDLDQFHDVDVRQARLQLDLAAQLLGPLPVLVAPF